MLPSGISKNESPREVKGITCWLNNGSDNIFKDLRHGEEPFIPQGQHVKLNMCVRFEPLAAAWFQLKVLIPGNGFQRTLD